MALADYGFETTFEATQEDQLPVLSLDKTNIRNGYALRPSRAAAGIQARLGRILLSAVMAATGVFLMTSGETVVSAEASGAALLLPIGAYLLVSAILWVFVLARRPQELAVDQRGRAFHLIKCNLHGEERSRQTIRFEEVVKITMIDHLASLDMRANAMNWDMGRIDVTWRQDKVTAMITGDVAELEPLLQSLRREVGLG
ncbi:hypothetical protein N9M66_04665 [Litoreibacter sp.]|nr:hypothetical protein [Litoreibacter sp.]